MAGDKTKFMTWDAGNNRQALSTPVATGTHSAGDAGKVVGLGANGDIDPTLLPPGVGPTVVSATNNTAVQINAGRFVHLKNVGVAPGTLEMEHADATDGSKPANGFVLADVAIAASGNVYTDGLDNAIAFADGPPFVVGDRGSRVFLAATAVAANQGKPTKTAPSGAGNLIQSLGFIVDANSVTSLASVDFMPGELIVID